MTSLGLTVVLLFITFIALYTDQFYQGNNSDPVKERFTVTLLSIINDMPDDMPDDIYD
jgi:hypothetical protein